MTDYPNLETAFVVIGFLMIVGWPVLWVIHSIFKKKNPKYQVVINDNLKGFDTFTCTAHGKPIKPKEEKRKGNFEFKISKKQKERLQNLGKSFSKVFKLPKTFSVKCSYPNMQSHFSELQKAMQNSFKNGTFYTATKEKKTMATIEQALERAENFAHKKMIEGYTVKLDTQRHLSFHVHYNGKEICGSITAKFPFDPPLKAYPEGTTGYGDGNLTKIVNCKDNYYECSRQKTPGVYPVRVDNFEPLPVYAELEQYKKALDLSCEQYCHDMIGNCHRCLMAGEHCHTKSKYNVKNLRSKFLDKANE